MVLVVLVGNIVYHYYFRLDRGVVHVVLVILSTINCLMFDRGVVHFVLDILSTTLLFNV